MAPALRRLLCLLLAFLALALFSGCGKKGPLIPPEALAPAAVTDLAVAQKGGLFEVSWSAPSRQEGGGRLPDLAGFLLFRRPVLPAAQDCEECPTAYSQKAKVYLDYPQAARKIGNRYLLDDYELEQGKSYQYKVRSFTTEGVESKDSNKVRRSAVTPPPPPVLEALPAATGVVLAFVALPPAEGTPVGFNIYRTREGGPKPFAPLNSLPVVGPTYEDKEVLLGTRYDYWITSVIKVNEQIVESVPSNVATGGISGRD